VSTANRNFRAAWAIPGGHLPRFAAHGRRGGRRRRDRRPRELLGSASRPRKERTMAKQYDAAPALVIDPARHYSATIATERATSSSSSTPTRSASRSTISSCWLATATTTASRSTASSPTSWPRRRPDRHRPRRPRLPVRRRVRREPAPRWPRRALHGQRRPEYQRLAVLHHPPGHAAPRRQARRVRRVTSGMDVVFRSPTATPPALASPAWP